MEPAIGTRYVLTKSDLYFCVEIGVRRSENTIKANGKEQKYASNKSGVDASIQGVIGEYVFLHLFGFSKNHLNNTTPNSRKNDRGDCVYKGLKIDVKCPEGHQFPLQTREENKLHPSHIYALCSMSRKCSKQMSSTDVSSSPSSAQPITLPTGYTSSLLKLCTYTADDEIEVIYKGCITAQKLYESENYMSKKGQGYYVYPQSKLLSLNECCDSIINKTPLRIVQNLPNKVNDRSNTRESKAENIFLL